MKNTKALADIEFGVIDQVSKLETSSERQMLTVAEYAALEKRYVQLQEQFIGNQQAVLSTSGGMRHSYAKELCLLMEDGFDLPKPGLYIVAAFLTLPRNRLQSLGRTLYYRSPHRFHFLLPLLGETAKPRHPGHAGPGMWRPPLLRP